MLNIYKFLCNGIFVVSFENGSAERYAKDGKRTVCWARTQKLMVVCEFLKTMFLKRKTLYDTQRMAAWLCIHVNKQDA